MNTKKPLLLLFIYLNLFGGVWGYIDTTGNWAIEPQFDYAGDFSEGLTAVEVSR